VKVPAGCLNRGSRGAKGECGACGTKWTASRCKIAALEAIKTPFKLECIENCNQVVGSTKWVRQIKVWKKRDVAAVGGENVMYVA